jgi:RNA polymerase sigma factor (TIGR02999 family)
VTFPLSARQLSMNAPQRLTEQLRAWQSGDQQAGALLSQEIYAALKRLARSRTPGGSASATLNPTALVNEAMLRLLGSDTEWQSRAHFFAVAAAAMRSVLVDSARRRRSEKHGGSAVRVTLGDDAAWQLGDDGFLDLHEALGQLAANDPRTARAIELTYFGGLNAREVAEVSGLSIATVERDLAFGRAWLQARLQP